MGLIDRWLAVAGRVPQMAGLLAALIHNRVELLQIELQEERNRLVRLLSLALAAALLAGLTLALALCALFYALDERHRLPALCLVALGAGVATAVVVLRLRRGLSGPPPFADFVDELRKDKEMLWPGDREKS